MITEAELRARFGLVPRVLAAIRQDKLREDEHWKKEGREICYTPVGVEQLRQLLALVEKKGAPAPPPASPSPEPVVAPPMSIKLTRVRLPNTRIVLGRETGADPDTPIVRVRVKTSVNLRIGMVLKDCHSVDVENGLWEFRARLPRFPGKW